jgi:hypothetical protein
MLLTESDGLSGQRSNAKYQMHSYSFYHMNLIHPSQPSHLNLTVKKTNSVTALTPMLKQN